MSDKNNLKENGLIQAYRLRDIGLHKKIVQGQEGETVCHSAFTDGAREINVSYTLVFPFYVAQEPRSWSSAACTP